MEVTTIFDSDRAEYEYMKEQIEKQAIEEMARKMCRNYMPNGNCAADDDPCGLECVYGYCAERIYCAGYSRQEWISVKERLPETETPVLIFTKKGTYYVGYYYKGSVNPGFTGFYSNGCKRDATHWMPLPEPPKMKVGAE